MKFKTGALSALLVSTLIPALLYAQNTNAAKTRVKKTRTPAETAAPSSMDASSAVGTSRTSSNSASNTWAWMKSHMTVGGLVSSASSFDLGGARMRANGQSLSGGGNLGTSNALGVEAQLMDFRDAHWGWFASASIEQTREISTINLSLSEGRRLRGNFSSKPNFRPLNLSGGAVYRLNDKIYFMGGLNYTLYKEFNSGDFDSASLDSKPGYQFGVAFKPIPRLALELSQKTQRYSFAARDGQTRIDADDATLQGIAFTGRYSLE